MRLLLSLLLVWGSPLFAGDLLKDGGFETPAVQARTPKDQGGDPTNNGKGPGWISFNFRNTGSNGLVTGGLTNEVAHSGRQSLFIRFDHVNGAYRSASLVSNLIPVVSGTDYVVGIWGRNDARDIINSEGRSAYLKLEIDYFGNDGNASVGDPVYRVQPLPSSKGHVPFFKPDAWAPLAFEVTTPPGAVFAQITWRWETGSDPGEVNGVMFFDDAAMSGPPNANPDLTPAPVQDETPAPGASAAPQ